MKTFLTIGYSASGLWRCAGDPTVAPGQSCVKIPPYEFALLVCAALCAIVLFVAGALRLRKARMARGR
jgi:hypothetical protein